MREHGSGGGAAVFLIMLVAAMSLLMVHICNGEDAPGLAEETDYLQETPQERERTGLPAPAPETEEEALRRTANKLLNCTVTYYCAELYEHICGTGDGLTATGVPVVPYKTCAVDPGIIPLGSTVWVDYGDGILHEYTAQDVGGAVTGGHIDLAVTTHEEANACGVKTATVYWKEK